MRVGQVDTSAGPKQQLGSRQVAIDGSEYQRSLCIPGAHVDITSVMNYHLNRTYIEPRPVGRQVVQQAETVSVWLVNLVLQLCRRAEQSIQIIGPPFIDRFEEGLCRQAFPVALDAPQLRGSPLPRRHPCARAAATLRRRRGAALHQADWIRVARMSDLFVTSAASARLNICELQLHILTNSSFMSC
eukprot:6199724-Pleurochrysis_carterae.AAC.1